jgi:transketolase
MLKLHIKMSTSDLIRKALKIRRGIIEMLVPLESHHIGCSLSIVEILTFLYFEQMKINPKNPKDPNRDIFILSKGHAGAALYTTLAEKGFFDKKILKEFDINGGFLPEHVTSVVPGIELSTGSLGHGLPVGCGFTQSFKNDNKKNRVVVLISDGELNEGSNWEAMMFASSHKLDNLTVIVDCNKFQGYGKTKDIIDLTPLSQKIKAFGWNYFEINGHSFKDLKKIFEEIKNIKNNKPNFILANTIKGKGISFFEGKFESHYKSITKEEKINILKGMK